MNRPWPVAVLLVAALGCVEVNGGAVELSWEIQDETGEGAECAAGRLGPIQLLGTRLDAASVGFESDEWDCERHHGVTKFEIDTGRWSFDLVVRCDDFRLADVRVPDPIVRDVRDGEVVQLNALLIVIKTDPSSGSCPVPSA